MKNYIIGVAGLASYATLDLAKKIVNAFPAEKEWDRPHLIIDNNCMIPSRVRGILYGENQDIIIEEMTNQIKYLMDGGADRIIVDCNTAHYYLPEVYKRIPQAEKIIINLIENCAEYLKEVGGCQIGLIASEGVLDTGIYSKVMESKGIKVNSPEKQRYPEIRRMIEAVKVNHVTKEIVKEYASFIESFSEEYIVLGCTEIPVIRDIATNMGCISKKEIIDPIDLAINRLVVEYADLPAIKDFRQLN